jgi:hypothetical protein
MTGTISLSPGSRTPITLPKRKCTPISYCCTMRIASSRARNAAKTTAITATILMLTSPTGQLRAGSKAWLNASCIPPDAGFSAYQAVAGPSRTTSAARSCS